MTNQIAAWLALLIAGFVAADLIWFEAEATLFLFRKLQDVIDYLAFWR